MASQSLISQQRLGVLNQEALKQSLQKSVLFRDVAAGEVEQIIAAGHWLLIEQGEYVYQQADNNRIFYIVADGEAELTLTGGDGSQLMVSRIGPGGHFGETSLLTNSCNSINVRAMSALSLLCFDADAFNSVLLVNNAIQRQLSIALANRLRVSFHDHASALSKSKGYRAGSDDKLDASYFLETKPSAGTEQVVLDTDRGARLSESTIARQVRKAVKKFSDNLEPVLLTGESGTGRRMVAYEIHRASAYRNGPYTAIDINHFVTSSARRSRAKSRLGSRVTARVRNSIADSLLPILL